MAQFDLFGAPVLVPTDAGRRASRSNDIGAVVPAPELVALGEALPGSLYLGTSSWSFPGWAGLVYARSVDASRLSRDGLPAYARHPLLRSVGIDRTFYSPLSVAGFARHAAQVPAHFRFLVKAPSACTSVLVRADGQPAMTNDLFLDERVALDEFIAPALEGLGNKAGPLVFQFPPLGRAYTQVPQRFADALYGFLCALRAQARGALLAVEVRDPEVLSAAFFAALGSTGVRYCVGVHARMPSVVEQARLARALGAGALVVRWNLHSGFGYDEAKSRYAPFDRLVDEDLAARHALADLAVEAIGAGEAVYIIANNKAEGSAPLTLTRLAEAVRERLRAMTAP
ncbi:MAG: DUF72 domain-containing protein [Proteobacteria bacterium]|nr:DUF72 domain-containing protein [Burkholderiales bacterium]